MKTILLLSICLLFNLNAETISGDTSKKYSKPGAAINIHYSSQKVNINETSDVNITLKTTLNDGTLFTSITVDKELEKLNNIEQNLTFTIKPNEKNFIINLQVNAQKEGLYYIRLLCKINNNYGTKLRSFAVPVYIGTKQKKIVPKEVSTTFKALNAGENISVSKAIETIKILKK